MTIAAAKTSADVRTALRDALRLDLIGPRPAHPPHEPYANEILPQAPSQWYLTGFLVTTDAAAGGRSDDTGDDQLDQQGQAGGGDDESTPESSSARKAFFPSSMGLSVLITDNCHILHATVRWGDYRKIPDGDGAPRWQRTPREERVQFDPLDGSFPITQSIPKSGGMELVISASPVSIPDLVPDGTHAISVFLVNNRPPAPDAARDESTIFQPDLILHSDLPFVPRPDPRGRDTADLDERTADLQYRDVMELAVGHNVSAVAMPDPDGACHEVSTEWVPVSNVEKVVPNEDIAGVDLRLESLAGAASADEARRMLEPMVAAYADWIQAQRRRLPTDPRRREVADYLMVAAERARDRMTAGLDALDEPLVLEAFRIANRAVARAIRQRACHGREDLRPDQVDAPRWRPFQIAFILTNLRGLADPAHTDRKTVDLLFFPTGGGKTEAYLGLAAFGMALRRLRDPSIRSAGVTVLMRYTLRLLTLDQLSRAATLLCALELERQSDVEKLGTWPLEIGLWVGQTATPNRMGKKGDGDQHTARARTIAFLNDSKRKPSPIPLENCPWCGARFQKDSFHLLPNPDEPGDLRVFCSDRDCEFNSRRQQRGLPVLAVDDSIYRRLPAFLVATVDKFANLPWVGATAGLFGKVDHCDDRGFYGRAWPGGTKTIEGGLPPPDLIIQDELHLISGPLGTMVGLYETAVDALSAREGDGSRPKIVASTATVRRAEQQIRGLFGRTVVDVFPPPGPDRRDSFFARTVPIHEANGRTYLGIAAQGRNQKVVLMRTLLTLLGAAQKEWQEAGGARNRSNPADPYMTVMAYFNALRELGGARRIIEDEVRTRTADYGSRRLRVGESAGLFADRKKFQDPCELTSRESTNVVAETKRRLALPFSDPDRVDVALATNMISVGLDITRLGLMVVVGQPKTAAEYIQATSRVGRDSDRPGLVVTLLNVHRPRDRSHYERFVAWHECFYRAVEASSVTPFSPRAVDRGLAGVTVALARLGHPEMTAPRQAGQVPRYRPELGFVAEILSRRAEAHDGEMTAEQADHLRRNIQQRVMDLLDKWVAVAQGRGDLQYQKEVGVAPPLLYDPLDPELERQPPEARLFKAGRSLRDVEPSVNLWLRNPDGFTMEVEP